LNLKLAEKNPSLSDKGIFGQLTIAARELLMQRCDFPKRALDPFLGGLLQEVRSRRTLPDTHFISR
jgi:hypothetical protein